MKHPVIQQNCCISTYLWSALNRFCFRMSTLSLIGNDLYLLMIKPHRHVWRFFTDHQKRTRGKGRPWTGRRCPQRYPLDRQFKKWREEVWLSNKSIALPANRHRGGGRRRRRTNATNYLIYKSTAIPLMTQSQIWLNCTFQSPPHPKRNHLI